MSRQRNVRSATRESGLHRVRASKAAVPLPDGAWESAGGTPDGPAISFLSDVLVGDSSWTMAEVQRLVVVRDLADLGRWRVSGLDDEGTTSG